MKAILTAVGRDRPGIVAGVAKALLELGCNVEDSQMSRLGGEFAMMLLVKLKPGTSPDDVHKRLEDAGKRLNLWVSARALEPGEETAPGNRPVFALSVYGADRPGIVYDVADFLARQRVNITDLTTRVIGETGRPIYCMVLEVELPEGTDPKRLEKALIERAAALKVDLNFRPVEAAEL